MINRVVLSGRLTKEVSLAKTTSGKSVASFSLAVQRNIKNQAGEYEADFINCVVWGATADYLNKYVQKGNLINVEGRLQTRSYTASDGKNRNVTEVVVDLVQLISTKTQPKEEEFDTGNPLEISSDDLPF